MPKVVSDRARWLHFNTSPHALPVAGSSTVDSVEAKWRINRSSKPPYQCHTVAATVAANICSSVHRYGCWKSMARHESIHNVQPACQ
jgi:hypothetical protein